MSEAYRDISTFYDFRKIKDQYSNDFIRSNSAVKLSEDKDIVTVAISENADKKIRKTLTDFHYPKKLFFEEYREAEFVEFVGNCVEQNNELQKEITREVKDSFSLNTIESNAPAVNIINAILLEALRKNTSDIHLESEATKLRIRFRIDGVLSTVKLLSKESEASIISRIKIMSGMNIMESRQPQDSRMSVKLEDKNMDFRVSTVPSVNGESIVLRIFSTENENIPLDELGFSQETLKALRSFTTLPNGLVLVTGPTGSGKSTTLHAILMEMDRESNKIITIEDPVESVIENVTQIQTNDAIGLNFSSLLKRVLRQDPDVIMVGEIRDSETARLAIRAALTGHLIFATLHTNDSISAVARLIDMGIEPYLIANVIRAVMAQRLVRKGNLKAGYKGRTVISEFCLVNEKMQSLISKNSDIEILRNYALENGMKTLRDDALRVIGEGLTDTEEAKRAGVL